MKPDWDKLEKEFKSSDVVTIADVDCTAAGQPICQKVGVQGYPTIKYWTPKSGKGGSDYKGGRDYSSLKSFVTSTFKASCDPVSLKGCNDQEKRYIDKVKDKSVDELIADQKEKEEALKASKKEKSELEKAHKEQLKTIKKKETALQKAITVLKALQNITKSGKKSEKKTEKKTEEKTEEKSEKKTEL
eukprot:GEMP01053015.1.p1 GENE.GEMP01053015.1~~GEMP01053015.1.p1  ORF type:complete len:188 (+),score=58.01 GEMP01053015.1:199-762(+)